ncbi:30S ribosome-binding factor RbfA [Peptostreptococcaceae bacterium AGR-M142]
MGYARTSRISEEMKKVLGQMISKGEIKDPRINSLMSITNVDVTSDLSYAYIYISVFGSNANESLKGLNKAKGYIRKELGRRVKLRHTPELIFKIDDSIEKGIKMSKLINEVNKKEEDSNE